MKADPRQEELYFSGKPTKLIVGDRFTVKIFEPFALRYFARGKQVTFGLELRKRENSWWIFGGYWGVYVENPLCWDDEDEPLGVRTAEMIVSDVREALRKNGGEKYYQFLQIPKGE